MSAITIACKAIYAHKNILSTQQMRTLKGQVLNGNIEGAMKGLETLVKRVYAERAHNE